MNWAAVTERYCGGCGASACSSSTAVCARLRAPRRRCRAPRARPRRTWCRAACGWRTTVARSSGSVTAPLSRRWEDRNLYLGSRFEETPLGPLLPSSSSEGPSWTRSHRSPALCYCGKKGQPCNAMGVDCACGGTGRSIKGAERKTSSAHADVEPRGRRRRRRVQRLPARAAGRNGCASRSSSGTSTGRKQSATPKTTLTAGRVGRPRTRWHLVNRFGQGVSENCGLGLWLDEREYQTDEPWTALRQEAIDRRRRSEFGAPCGDAGGARTGAGDGAAARRPARGPPLEELLPPASVRGGARDPVALAEEAVEAWERGRARVDRRRGADDEPRRHRRRYALAPRPLFLRGAGPWAAQPGDSATAAGVRRRALSAAAVLRQPPEIELCPPLPRAQLADSISCEAIIGAPPDLELPRRARRRHRGANRGLSRPSAHQLARAPPLLFWTARYWYRPYPRRAIYHRLQRLLSSLRRLHERMARAEKGVGGSSDSPSSRHPSARRGSKLSRSPGHSSLYLQLLLPVSHDGHCENLNALRRALRPPPELSVWAHDSTALAQQLTLIDKELLLQVPAEELRSVWRRRNSKAAPRLRALLAFAHRIACLVASEVLGQESERTRARLISRFIAVANKCHRLQNFQSCHSVLAGLQSIPIHRLTKTWAYMRWKHASKYSLFERLCRRYRDPRMPSYQRTFLQAKLQPPFMPFVGDIFTHLFGYLPEAIDPYREFCFPDCERKVLCSLFPRPHTHWCVTPASSLHGRPYGSQSLNKRQYKESCVVQNAAMINRKFDSKSCTCIELESLTMNELSFIFLCEATNFLKECQQSVQKYSINKNLHTREYLLKARYQEDIDNYVRSIILEDKQSI